MAQIQKGTNVRFWVGSDLSETGISFFQNETSCSHSVQANTLDVSNKGDVNPEYDNVDFDDYEGTVSVEGNVSSVDEIKTMLRAMKSDSGKPADGSHMLNEWRIGTDLYTSPGDSSCFAHGSDYVMTSFELDMPADGLATMSASIDLIGIIHN